MPILFFTPHSSLLTPHSSLLTPHSSLLTPMRIAYLLFCALTVGCNHAQSHQQITHQQIMTGLEQKVDSLIEKYPEAVAGIAVRDLETGVSFNRNEGRLFHAASTMKIPVMIEVFRQAERGRFSMDDELSVINEFHSIVDSSLYSIEDDSDDAIYTKLGQQMSIRDLVYQMITVSSNLATNLLIDFVAPDSVQSTAVSLGIEKMKVLRGVEDLKAFDLGLSNSATAADLAILLEALRDGRAVSREADAEMIAVLLDQKFNEMIPAGLPETVRAAHKTGQITSIHHDAGVIYPENTNPYVLVILIEGIRDDSISTKLGVELTQIIHQGLRNSPKE